MTFHTFYNSHNLQESVQFTLYIDDFCCKHGLSKFHAIAELKYVIFDEPQCV